MPIQNKQSIHLWVFNHDYNGISDQVAFFISVFKQHGYAVSVGYKPRNSALNVVIENFSAKTKEILVSFCQSRKKRVAIIMTEHLDFENEKIRIHGANLCEDNDYMHPATQLDRIRYLMDAFAYIRCFFVLGDLPELRNMSEMMPGIEVCTIPFPKFKFVSNNNNDELRVLNSDFLFTGVMTSYRSQIYKLLKSNGFSIICPEKFVSQKKRNEMNRSVKLILNIPQRSNWRWLSLMRIIAALRCGRATISLGTQDHSQIADCTYQLDIGNPEWLEILKDHADNWLQLYQKAYDNYISMAEEYERLNGFPHDMIEYWSITDHLSVK